MEVISFLCVCVMKFQHTVMQLILPNKILITYLLIPCTKLYLMRKSIMQWNLLGWQKQFELLPFNCNAKNIFLMPKSGVWFLLYWLKKYTKYQGAFIPQI